MAFVKEKRDTGTDQQTKKDEVGWMALQATTWAFMGIHQELTKKV